MAVADRHLWLTRDRQRVVEAGDLAAGFLLAPTGSEIPVEDMLRLGLREVDGKIVIQAAAAGTEAATGGEADAEPDTAPVSPPPVVEKKKRGPKPKAVA